MKNLRSRWKGMLAIFAWSFIVQFGFTASGMDSRYPFGIFLYGDSARYLEQGHAMQAGEMYDAGLPFHPPMTAWLTSLVWSTTDAPATAHLASKALMCIFCGISTAILFGLTGEWLICFMIPFHFGLLILGSSVNSEALYMMLCLLLLAMGSGRPARSGIVHALALMTRAEHIIVIVVITIWMLSKRPLRRPLAILLATTAVIMIPLWIHQASSIHRYNTTHPGMPEALPRFPISSLYGPLNFGLAWSDAGSIHFSAKAVGATGRLDPSDPLPNRMIVHGYSEGMRWILTHPGRAVARAAGRLLFSLNALQYGWTWRDLPHKMEWIRHPVDAAVSESRIFLIISILILGLGIRVMKGRRDLLVPAGIFLLYRLAVNTVFFPYMRGILVMAPLIAFIWLQGATGWIPASKRRLVQSLLLAILVIVQSHGLIIQRDYYIQGPKDVRGRFNQDETFHLRYIGPYREESP